MLLSKFKFHLCKGSCLVSDDLEQTTWISIIVLWGVSQVTQRVSQVTKQHKTVIWLTEDQKLELSIHSHTTVFPTVQDLVIYHR